MRAFVTGSTGFLGRHLVRELLDHGYAVTALVRTFERGRQLPRGVRALPGDITKPESFRHGLQDADVVFHLAAITTVGASPRDYGRIQRINVDGARHVLEMAAEAGAAKIVHVSDVAVYGDTRGQAVDEAYLPDGAAFQNEYQRTKHAAHHVVAVPLQGRGAPLVIACPGAVYGPGDSAGVGRLLRLHARGRLLLLAGPDSAQSWTYVDDAVAGLRLAAEQGRPGETYNLAGPAHTLRDFFTACARVSRVPAPFVWLPSSLTGLLARALGRALPALAEKLRTLAGVTYLARSDKAVQELGWRAHALEDGLPPTIKWLRER
jgi:dihydroflavonol-4-reductase